MPTSNAKRSPPQAALPLHGIRVIDVASFIAAPVAATVLGDFGADVIKVEPTNGGDPNRTMYQNPAYPKSPVNYPWHLDSRRKRSLAIDLKNGEARDAFDKVIAASDVLITNLPMAARRRLRLDYETLSKSHPDVIHAALSGYGDTGPDADQLGFDINAYFARSGILDGARYDDQYPAVAMPAQGDRASGVSLALGIMIALWNRQQTGRGTSVTTSLLANGIWANGNFAQAALVGGTMPKRPVPETPRSAVANVYRTEDDRWLQLSLVREDRDWPTLCKAIDRVDLLSDPRFAETPVRRQNGADLAGILRAIIGSRDVAYWRNCLKQHGLAFAVLNRAADLPTDDQVLASGAIVDTAIPDMPRSIASPLALGNVEIPPPTPAPELGEHSVSILREAGVDAEVIARLRKSGAVI
ncbi:MAG: CaiB/BaiF CoA transferase family protein [Hyphomicrobiaceae bacterium]